MGQADKILQQGSKAGGRCNIAKARLKAGMGGQANRIQPCRFLAKMGINRDCRIISNCPDQYRRLDSQYAGLKG